MPGCSPIHAARSLLVSGAIALAAAPATAQVLQKEPPEEVQGIGIVDRRGTIIPQDITLRDADGREVVTAELFDGKRPVLLMMAYYECPLLCGIMLNNLQDTLNQMDWVAGEQFRVATVSFSHLDSVSDAAIKQATYHAGYVHELDMPEDGWNFYVTDAVNARDLSRAIGFHYRFLPDRGEFTHTSALYFLTPEGELHNFMENLTFDPRQVTFALNDAADGRTATLFERIYSGCFYLDPNRNAYVVHPLTVMKIGAGTGAVLLLGALAVLVGVHRGLRGRAAAKAATGAASA